MSYPNAQETRRDIGRDQWGRPLIEFNGKVHGYTRTSTLAKALEDEYNLTQWKMRQTALGVAKRPDLALAVSAHALDKHKLDELCGQAMEAASSSAAATTGTAIHEITNLVDLGHEVFVPDGHRGDIEAYQAATTSFEVVCSEQFSVCDPIKVAGTPDCIVRLLAEMVTPNGVVLPAGTLLVLDKKTGKSLVFGHLTYSAQLAVYARSKRYDLSKGAVTHYKGQEIPVGERTDWVPGERVSHNWGLILHLPAGQGRAELYWVDLVIGWQLANLAVTVREWRKRKDIITGPVIPPELDFHELARSVTSLSDLAALHSRAVAAHAWSPELRDTFSMRRSELEMKEVA